VRRVETIDGEGCRRVFEGSIVVGADGIRSVVARRLGFVKRKPRIWKISLTCRLRGTGPSRQQGSLFLCRQGTVGLAPIGANPDLWNGTVVVTGRAAGRAIAVDPRQGFHRVLTSAPFRWNGGGPDIVDGPWACGPFDWPVRAAVGDGVLLVGDAAGYFDPLTGQGIHQALRSAELAAPVVARAVDTGCTRAARLAEYQRALKRELRLTRAVQHAVEFSLSRPVLRDTIVSRLGTVSGRGFADRFIQVVGDAAPVGSLASPDVLVPLLAGW
jgi:flavin-dependent dehydrogenase